MDFFQAQDDARRRTKWLIVYFILALLGIIAAVYILTVIILSFTDVRIKPWSPGLFIPVAVGTSLLILGGSAFKSLQLSGGGSVVAEDLGGRLVDPGTSDHQERVLLNVVQEMAIASGTPVPQVYVMDHELGINAFAAGTEPGNAVIGVTRGCIDRLSRSELQGVIAHEFSHILNGDMRLNMRLIGVIFGILILMIIGRTVLHSMRFVSYSGGRSSKNNNSGGIAIAILVLGIGLLAIGGIGAFFARLIQSAVSRQREFLADASAVQFTREPDGLAGALMKIGGLDDGSKLASPKAIEASHMFFSEGGMFSWGLATHPPLDVRIRTILPHWQGDFENSSIPEVSVPRAPQAHAGLVSNLAGGQVSAPAALAQLGESSALQMDVGRQIREGLAPFWIQATQSKDGAQALLFAMLLSKDNPELQQKELEGLATGVGRDAASITQEWAQGVHALHSSDKIALLDMCFPSLRRMTGPEYERFLNMTRWLIASDEKTDLFEYMLQHSIARHLSNHFEQRAFPPIKHRRMSDLSEQANVLLSAVAHMEREGGDVDASFAAASEEWGESERWSPRLLPPDQCGGNELDAALREFEFASPIVKKQILRVCGLAAAHDSVLSEQEAELLRAVADAIGAGLPPFVGQLKDA